MAQSKVVYTPRADATPESERSALVAAYRLIRDYYTRKKCARSGAPDDAEGLKNDRTDSKIIPR